MRILITGGAGFIGTNLCKRLLNEGNTILCLDNFYSSSKTNITDLLEHPNFIFVGQDIVKEINFGGIDQIYHLACPASPVWYQKDPLYTFDVSVIGTRNVLNVARDNKAKILFTSTSEIYGDPLVHPQVETYWGNVNTMGPRSCYDEGKRAAETMIMEYGKKFDLDWKIVRLFNTYGPYLAANDGRVVSNFIIQALNGEPITIYGKGMQTRSFCYVDDTVDALIKMMNTSKLVHGPINIGNPSEFTMIELAKKVLDRVDTTSHLLFKTLPVDDPKQRKPDITLAKTVLSWQPMISLDVGLQKTIDYFRIQGQFDI
jgi:UDP-glucuronate decarboxylase